MAKKTNCVINGKKMYRLRYKSAKMKTYKNFIADCYKNAVKKRDDYIAELSNQHTFKSCTFGELLAFKV